MIRILIADDDPVVRRGLRQILEEESDVRVVGEAADADEAPPRLHDESCDVLVLDLSMPGAHGIDLLQQLPTYRARMLDKLGVGSNAEATRYVLEHELFDA